MQPKPRFNPVAFVCPKEEPRSGLERAVAIATTAKDVFSVGEAVVDGFVFYKYATGARALVGVP